MTDKMGRYGTDYLFRSIVARIGLGSNWPEDASTHSREWTPRANH